MMETTPISRKLVGITQMLLLWELLSTGQELMDPMEALRIQTMIKS